MNILEFIDKHADGLGFLLFIFIVFVLPEIIDAFRRKRG
jgi:hypothetical protein